MSRFFPVKYFCNSLPTQTNNSIKNISTTRQDEAKGKKKKRYLMGESRKIPLPTEFHTQYQKRQAFSWFRANFRNNLISKHTEQFELCSIDSTIYPQIKNIEFHSLHQKTNKHFHDFTLIFKNNLISKYTKKIELCAIDSTNKYTHKEKNIEFHFQHQKSKPLKDLGPSKQHN